MRWPTKEEISVRFAQHPSIDAAVRLLLFHPWFRLMVLAFVAVVGVVGVLPWKIWRTSPPDTNPVVRVSLLDFLQAAALKRSAERHAGAGEDRESLRAWQYALGNNPGDLDLVRGFLNQSLTGETEQGWLRSVLQRSQQLILWGGTNTADVDLVSRVYEKHEWDEMLAEMLGGLTEPLSAEQKSQFLKAMFRAGNFEGFAKHWESWKAEEFARSGELTLFRTAYLAGWGVGPESVEAMRALQSAADKPEGARLALELQLAVSAARKDLPRYKESLEKQQALEADRFKDHVTYWRLLSEGRRRDEALALIRNHPKPPKTLMEMIAFAQVLVDLELLDDAREFLKRVLPQVGILEGPWMVYAEILTRQGRWDELRDAALEMRRIDAFRTTLAGMSYFFEGRADLAQDRAAKAAELFQKCGAATYDDPAIGMLAVNRLCRIGRHDLTVPLLAALEKPMGGELKYWESRLTVADTLKDAEMLLEAAEGAYNLDPKNALLKSYFASALVISQKRPAEASRLTLEVLQELPKRRSSTINRAFALLMNDRVEDAIKVLTALNPEDLSEPEAPFFYFAALEAALRQGNFRQATEFEKRIDATQLFINQRLRLDGFRTALAGAETGAVQRLF